MVDERSTKKMICPRCRDQILQTSYLKPGQSKGGMISVGRICANCAYFIPRKDRFPLLRRKLDIPEGIDT